MSEIVDSPSVVNESEKRNLKHSYFPLSQLRFTTEVFGLVKPHVIFDGVADDRLRFRSPILTRSYTLKAPLMQDVHRRTSYVKVDMPAILPFNFDKFFTNPVVGQDVPSDVGCVIPTGFFSTLYNSVTSDLTNRFSSFLASIRDANGVLSSTILVRLSFLVRSLVIAELFYSRGSLLSALGCRISKHLVFGVSDDTGVIRRFSFDRYFDSVFALVVEFLSSFVYEDAPIPASVSIDDKPYVLSSDEHSSSLSYHAFLDLIRDTPQWVFTSPVEDTVSFDSSLVARFSSLSPRFIFPAPPTSIPFNFGRVCSYQLAIAEFMTNDHVDNIYNAELFRQYIGSLIRVFSTDIPSSFTVNGVSYQYDYLSGHYLLNAVSLLPGISSLSSGLSIYQYFLSLFGYRRSLRYKDYFVSSRVSPLAVGDVNVNVTSNQVNVVDITRNIQRQRFFNRVNHIGRDLRNYIRGIFGVEIQPDRHVPHYLVDFEEKVYTSEVENTADAQQTKNNSITATFTGNTGNKEIEVFVDVPCFIIGLQSYDIERTYIDNIERSFFIKDRYDMFIPELQFVGDQPIYVHELNSGDGRAFGSAFGYTYRDMQYKLLIPSSDGGFVEFLPGYNFMYLNESYGSNVINSGFIRSLPAELDGFYLSMTGYSLASRFHFISKIENIVDATRPMIANPNILE